MKASEMPEEAKLATPTRTGWMSPMNKIIWFKAFKKRATEVTLVDGRKFTLDYDQQPGKVYLQYVDGFVPCGTLDLEKVSDPIWLTTSSTP